MNYRSISDLSDLIRLNLYKIPSDVDLVVGIPRSGMLAANIISLSLNLKFCDIESFLGDSPLAHGRTRQVRYPGLIRPSDAKHVLVIDDSIDSGESLRLVREKISCIGYENQEYTFAACFATTSASNMVDLYFESVEQPRIFEWNLMHRPFLENCCIDIDGVLCVDPTHVENDDGEKYRLFLLNAKPLMVPSHPLGILVTSRLEKYRSETERWLKKNGFIYKKLEMLDFPSAEMRRKLGIHAKFKAEIFRKQSSIQLFIESDATQAHEIARLSGKPCLCFGTQEFFQPGFSNAHVKLISKKISRRIAGKAYRVLRGIFSR